MRASPNLPLLLKRIGFYLAKAEAKGSKQKQELKAARAALRTIFEILYGKGKYAGQSGPHPTPPTPPTTPPLPVR